MRKFFLTATCIMSMIPFASVSVKAQTEGDLIGVWLLYSVTTERNGKKIEPWGPKPKGMLVLDKIGRFSQHQMRSDRPKYAGKGRLSGTADDNKRVAHQTLGYFGTYKVDNVKRTISFHYEASTYPNQEGTVGIRPYTLSGEDLFTRNPGSSMGRAAGGGGVTLHWKRAKQ